MTNRLAFYLIAMMASAAAVPSRSAAQETSPGPVQETYLVSRIANLAFSNDGSLLREIQVVSVNTREFQQLRSITYDATTGSRRGVRDLDPDSYLFSATTDGRLAIVSVDVDSPVVPAHLLLVDMDTGRAERLPSKWIDPDDRSPYAEVSGDGRLVSIYASAGTGDRPRYVVRLFDWRTKKLVAQQYTDMSPPFIGISGGGGVTPDGKIAFFGGRSGESEVIVDPLSGKELGRVDPYSYRSPDGAWIIQFADPNGDDSQRQGVVKNGFDGREAGKLDLKTVAGTGTQQWGDVAFCGTSGRIVTASFTPSNGSLQVFEIPSGKRLAEFVMKPPKQYNAVYACNVHGTRVALQSDDRLMFYNLK